MMRGLTGTVLWGCVAAAIGVGLFFIKHEVKEQEARLAELNSEIHRNQEAIHVLKAEWSYLNDPARLRQLSEKYLGMKPMAPAQIATLDSLPRDDAPAYAAAPAAPAVKAEPVRMVKAEPVKVAKAEPASIAKAEPASIAKAEPAVKVEPVKAPRIETRLVAGSVPPPASASTGRRTIIIQSPALVASETTPSVEAR